MVAGVVTHVGKGSGNRTGQGGDGDGGRTLASRSCPRRCRGGRDMDAGGCSRAILENAVEAERRDRLFACSVHRALVWRGVVTRCGDDARGAYGCERLPGEATERASFEDGGGGKSEGNPRGVHG
jgi:hypothetical protein